MDFINEFLKKNLLKDKKQLINTNFSKKIEINEKILKKIMLGIESKKKELSVDEEIDFIIGRILKKAKMNEIKDYLPNKINVDPFPTEKKNKNEGDDDLSMETQITYKDTFDLLGELN